MVNLITIVTAYIQTSQMLMQWILLPLTETNVISGEVIVGNSSFNYWQTVQTLIRLLLQVLHCLLRHFCLNVLGVPKDISRCNCSYFGL